MSSCPERPFRRSPARRLALLAVLFPAILAAPAGAGEAAPPAPRAEGAPRLIKAAASVRVSQPRIVSGRGPAVLPTFAEIEMAFFVEGIDLQTVVRRVTLTRVVDDLGTVLPLPAVRAQDWGIFASRSRTGTPLLTGRASLTLPGGAGRRHLQVLEGTIEFSNPSDAAGSVVRFANPQPRPEVLSHPALDRLGVAVRYLDPAGTEAMASSMSTGVGRPPGPPPPPASRFESGPSLATFHVLDPRGVLLGGEFQDAGGRSIRMDARLASGEPSRGQLAQFRLASPLPAQFQLVLFLAPPESIRTLPFRIERVPIPASDDPGVAR